MKLTPKTKQAITNDWLSAFPTMDVYKPLWLMRRYGPILIGILLERDSGNDRYLPISHVHSLASDLPAISLTMPARLVSDRNHAIRKIQVRHHKRDWREAASALMAQSFVPLELESLNHDLLIELYTKFIRSETAMYPNKLFEDIFALYIWCGMSEKANASLGSFRKVVDSWPQNVANKLGGGAVWEQSVLAKYSSRLQLHRSVEERIVELKLTGVPNGWFACR